MARPKGSATTRLVLDFAHSKRREMVSGYDEAAKRLGVNAHTLQVYVSRGHGETIRKVWDEGRNCWEYVRIRRIGTEPVAIAK